MMMKDDKRRSGMVAIIMKKLTGSEHEPKMEMEEHENTEMDYDHASQMAAESIMEAIQSKDSKKLRHSLKSFIEMCMSEEEQPDREEKEDY
jgi:hypothetical protein